MGDFADDALFAGLDEPGGWLGSMGRHRAASGDRRWRKTCRNCGQSPLYWATVRGRWVLHEKTPCGEVPHECRKDYPPCQ